MTLKQLSLGIAATAFCAAAVYAVNWTIEEWQYRALLADRALIAGKRDISVKPELTCPDPADTQVFVVFGQSNAANHAAEKLVAPSATFDFYDSRCFSGDDPQFSATGKGGSFWPAFARAQRDSGEHRPILMANVAVGNTRIAEWQPGTDNARHLQEQTRALGEKGYRISAFLFFQGEADRDTSEAAYEQGLRGIADITASLSPGSPLIVSDSSICAFNDASEEFSAPALTAARKSVIAERGTVHHGPYTDALDSRYRYDKCHFNAHGQVALGTLWSASVNEILGR